MHEQLTAHTQEPSMSTRTWSAVRGFSSKVSHPSIEPSFCNQWDQSISSLHATRKSKHNVHQAELLWGSGRGVTCRGSAPSRGCTFSVTMATRGLNLNPFGVLGSVSGDCHTAQEKHTHRSGWQLSDVTCQTWCAMEVGCSNGVECRRCGYVQSIESSRDVKPSGRWGEKWLTCRRAEVEVHEHDVNLILGIVALSEVLQRLIRTAIATGSRARVELREEQAKTHKRNPRMLGQFPPPSQHLTHHIPSALTFGRQRCGPSAEAASPSVGAG
jgi:hypothetical protein